MLHTDTITLLTPSRVGWLWGGGGYVKSRSLRHFDTNTHTHMSQSVRGCAWVDADSTKDLKESSGVSGRKCELADVVLMLCCLNGVCEVSAPEGVNIDPEYVSGEAAGRNK